MDVATRSSKPSPPLTSESSDPFSIWITWVLSLNGRFYYPVNHKQLDQSFLSEWPIIWGDVYSKWLFKRVHCEAWIHRHCELTGLPWIWLDGWFLGTSCSHLNYMVMKLLFRSPWHGRSGSLSDLLRQGCLTVDYKVFDSGHLATAHVYYCDNAYFQF
jgi:hypothetical protein